MKKAEKTMQVLHEKFKNWCGKENKLFTAYLGDGDTFTNGEVLAVHIGMAVAFPVITILTSFIENLNV